MALSLLDALRKRAEEAARAATTYAKTAGKTFVDTTRPLAESVGKTIAYNVNPNYQKAQQNIQAATQRTLQASTRPGIAPENKASLLRLSSQQAKTGQNIARSQISEVNHTPIQIAGSAAATAASLVGGPKMFTRPGAINAGVSAVLGGGINKAFGGSFAEGAGRATGLSPVFSGISTYTNPAISKLSSALAARVASPVTQQVASRMATGALNIPEGYLMNKAANAPYSLTDTAIDFASGVAGGGLAKIRGQVEQLDSIKLNLKGVNPQAFRMNPDDVEVLARWSEMVKKNQPIENNLNTDVARLVDRYFPGYKNNPNKDLVKLFQKIQDINYGAKGKTGTPPVAMGFVDSAGKENPTLDPIVQKMRNNVKLTREEMLYASKNLTNEQINEIGMGFKPGERVKQDVQTANVLHPELAVGNTQSIENPDLKGAFHKLNQYYPVRGGGIAAAMDPNNFTPGEFSALKSHLMTLSDPDNTMLRGAVIKAYGGRKDLVFGVIHDRSFKGQKEYLVMDMSDRRGSEHLKGRLRLHSTPISENAIVEKIDLTDIGSNNLRPKLTAKQTASDAVPADLKAAWGEDAPTVPLRQNRPGSYTNVPQIDNPLIARSVTPRTDLLKQADTLQQKGMDQLSVNQTQAEAAKAIRESYSPEVINKINKLKQIAKSKSFQEGDIETLISQDPKLVKSVVESVRENFSGISDEQALKMALDLPTRADTVVRRPVELMDSQELKKQAKQVQDMVYNAEATPETKQKIIEQNQKLLQENAKREFDEWQRFVRSQTIAATPGNQAQGVFNQVKNATVSPVSRGIDQLDDISGFSGGFRDLYRNFKAVYGKRFDEVKRVVLDPFDRAKGQYVDDLKGWSDSLDTDVVKRLKIGKGSKESAAVQNYGEGKMTLEEVKQMFPTKWQSVLEADQWFRKQYDTLLTQVNQSRRRIYGDNPEKIIPRRSDYYRHFREMAQGFQGLMNIFDTPANISSNLSGVSEFTNPKSKWASFMQKRMGVQTDEDAVGGFLDYIKAASYAKNIDPQTATFRNLAEELAGQTVEGSPNAGRINNFIEYLQDFSNDLAGKTNPMDRTVQKWIPGGRKTFKVIDWVNSRVKGNAVVANVSSAISQIFNVPQGIASANPVNATKGLGRSLASMFVKDTPMNQSTFIKERYSSNIFDKFESGLVADIGKFAKWMTGSLDEVGTKFIWNAHYEKALSEGIQNPVRYADGVTRSLVAGRGIGEVPLAQKARLTQLIAPFQLEVGNLWWVMKDFVDERAFGKLATLLVANYVFNRAAEKVRGSDVTFDPIQATIEAIQTFEEEGDKGIGALRAGGRIAGEVLSNVTGGQTIAALYPEYGVKVGETQLPNRRELFGEGDPTRFGSGLLAAEGIKDPLYKILPPYGGGQLKKTINGISDVVRGYKETPGGKVSYPIKQTPGNYVRAGLFGSGRLADAAEPRSEDRVYDALKSGGTPPLSGASPRSAANAIHRYLTNLPKEERGAGYQKVKSLLTDDIKKELQAIQILEQEGLTRPDRDLILIAPPVRARAIHERIMALDKKNRQAKFTQLVELGIITPAIKEELSRIQKESSK